LHGRDFLRGIDARKLAVLTAKCHAADGVLMEPRSTEIEDQPTADNPPEDVAVLYSWANLQGAKYRDYSASRREHRAQVRYRAARSLLERELKAQVDAEAAAAGAERLAAAQGRATSAGSGTGDQGPVSEETARLAAAERVEAARRAESAARAAVLALREEREIAEAHSSAKRQAQIYEESEARRRQLAGPQPRWPLDSGFGGEGDLKSDLPVLRQFLYSPGEMPPAPEPIGEAADSEIALELGVDEELNAPAWLASAQALLRPQTGPAVSKTLRADLAGVDTLQDSRERVAARWFALKDVFDDAAPELPAMPPLRTLTQQRPVLVVFSLSGGVGKTSLLATLGRALSGEGEKIAVADTTSQGLLPIYFGSNQAGRSGSIVGGEGERGARALVSLAVHDVQGRGSGERDQEALTEEILQSGQGNHRLLIDLATGSSWLIRRMVELHPTVLVPVAPDMNSVISMQAIERLCRGIVGAEGRSLLPFYVLNQFDAALALHLDVREVFRRQLGDRLLPFAIRRSPLVSEALAEGMTVLDYAPDARVSQDYKNIAEWLRSVSPPATEEIRGLRRGEG
jgi:cellulose synthase operon protein YhjQ